ncbi:MAG: amidophosphoribosyltransferase [Candidatus Micrarchaeota archaeon]|nr:amidophosphoribosyltransferase [Candidatus Micrarchaeota archaeon]
MMACGVLGIVLKDGEDDLKAVASTGLGTLNHRGENAHGVAVLDGNGRIATQKELGLVRDSKIFSNALRGNMLIGHTRYITSSESSMSNAQPIQLETESGIQYAISHNGNIANDKGIKSILRIEGNGVSDTRALGMLLGRGIGDNDLSGEMRSRLGMTIGSYSLAIVIGGKSPKLIATRDKYGYMPLFFGQNERGFFVASEPVTLSRKYLDAPYRPIAPGEMLEIDRTGVRTYQLFESQQKQYCMFQWIYMCRPDSTIEGANVYKMRESMGFRIAGNYRPDVDCIVPVPDSGISVAYGYNQATGIPIRMGIVKDRYESKRSFMQEDQKLRVNVVNKKLSVVAEVVKGNRVLLMDDSLVRGTTIAGTIKELRDAGANEVHIAVSCPPIISQCHFGLDFYNKDLIARQYMDRKHEKMSELVAAKIGADSFYYPTIPDLVSAIGVREKDLCLSCLNGKYVQDVPQESEESRKG